jgi:hypothetical protein
MYIYIHTHLIYNIINIYIIIYPSNNYTTTHQPLLPGHGAMHSTLSDLCAIAPLFGTAISDVIDENLGRHRLIFG